jgi:hypothetical protein
MDYRVEEETLKREMEHASGAGHPKPHLLPGCPLAPGSRNTTMEKTPE